MVSYICQWCVLVQFSFGEVTCLFVRLTCGGLKHIRVYVLVENLKHHLLYNADKDSWL